jgi:hypothetical protein
MGAQTPPGLSDEKAARMMVALREGQTLRRFSISVNRFKAYCEAHPDYGQEALPLIDANAMAAILRKGNTKREKASVVCLRGLHPMTGENVTFHHGRRQCLGCRRAAAKNPPLASLTPDVIEKMKIALRGGATVGEISAGKPRGGGKAKDPSLILVQPNIFYRYRQLNPEFDRFVAEAIADSNSVGQKIRFSRVRARKHTARAREEANDYHAIRAMFPANFPGRDDAAHDLFLAVFEGSLKRSDVKARVKDYVRAHHRMFPTKYAKFGDRPLLSLDEVLFDDGATIRGDTVSRGLWD